MVEYCEKTDAMKLLKMEQRMRRTDSINDCRKVEIVIDVQ